MSVQHYAAADGTRLAYQRHGAGSQVVLCHAGFVDRREWAGLVPLLAHDHTVVTPDRRGHGASDGYRDDHRLDHDIDDLRRLVELVTEPTERAVLVAHSAACYVALGTALESRRIASLILYEPPTFGQPAIIQELWDRLDRAREAEDRAQLVALLLNEVVGPSTGQVLPPPALEGCWPARSASGCWTMRCRFRPSCAATKPPAGTTTSCARWPCPPCCWSASTAHRLTDGSPIASAPWRPTPPCRCWPGKTILRPSGRPVSWRLPFAGLTDRPVSPKKELRSFR